MVAFPRTSEPGFLLCGFIYHSKFDVFSLIDKSLKPVWGDIFLSSPEWDFSSMTDYYKKEMGPHLKRRFCIFDSRIYPYDLVDIKLFAIDIEQKFSQDGARQVNIDPGFISHNKLILASTKNHYHRIYLDKGIYAELTMAYYHNLWHSLDWTYPDFAHMYLQWFNYIRGDLLENLLKQR